MHEPSESHEVRSLRQSITLEQYIFSNYAIASSPFGKPRWYLLARRRFFMSCARFVQWMFKREVYVTCDNFFSLNARPETRLLLKLLVNKGYISGWEFNELLPGFPAVNYAELKISPIILPNGSRARIEGGVGSGSGHTIDDAFVVATSELIERLSVGLWSEQDTVNKNHVPESKCRVIDYVGGQHPRRKNHTDDVVSWVKSDIWNSKKRDVCYLPTSLVFFLFTNANPRGLFLGESTTNGCCSHRTIELAEYGAIMELIERDGFLRAWYQKSQCMTVSLESVKEHVSNQQKELLDFFIYSNLYSLRIIDVTSEFEIPTFAALVIKEGDTGYEVETHLACDIDPVEAMTKVLGEVCTFLHQRGDSGLTDKKKNQFINETFDVTNMSTRRNFWSNRKSLKDISWFFSGEEHEFDYFIKKYNIVHGQIMNASTKDKNLYIMSIMEKHKVTVYRVVFKNDLIKHAGLHVVRMISPDLIPIFFSEVDRPMNVRRFTHKNTGEKATINNLPHPML